MKWNARLRYERESRGWTQGWVAQEIGANTYTVNRWENGHAFPSHFFRQQLSQLFGKSLEELGLVRLVSESTKSSGERPHIPTALQDIPQDGQVSLMETSTQAHTPAALQPLPQDGQVSLMKMSTQAHTPAALQPLPQDEQVITMRKNKQARISSALQELLQNRQAIATRKNKPVRILSALQELPQDWQAITPRKSKQACILSALQESPQDWQAVPMEKGEQAHALSGLRQQLSLLYHQQTLCLPSNTHRNLPLIERTWHRRTLCLALTLLLSVIVALMAYVFRPLEMAKSDTGSRSLQKRAQSVITPLILKGAKAPYTQYISQDVNTVAIQHFMRDDAIPIASGGTLSSTSYEAEAPQNTLAGSTSVVNCFGCSGRERVEQVGRGGMVQFNNVSESRAGNYKLTLYYTNGSSDRTLYMRVNDKSAIALNLSMTSSWHTVGTFCVPVSLNAGKNTIVFSNPLARGPDIDKIVV